MEEKARGKRPSLKATVLNPKGQMYDCQLSSKLWELGRWGAKRELVRNKR